MKKYILFLIILILILTSCASVPTVTVTILPSVTTTPTEQSVMPPVIPPQTEASTSKEPSVLVPDTDKTDIFKSTGEFIANSNYTLYEDEKYIFYLNQNDTKDRYLYRIAKHTGDVVQITDKDCSCFTVNNGIVYYTELSEPNEGYWNVIKSYNPSTNKKRTVKKFNYSIASMAAYNNKIYFSYFPKNSEASVSNLYVMDFDGTGMKEIKVNVNTFCIYRDDIYYTGCDYSDGAPLRKCNFDGNDNKEIKDWIDGYFDIGDNRLFYESGFIDLANGESLDMVYDKFAPLGQYLIYNDYTWKVDKGICYFHLYDFNSKETVNLIQIEVVSGHSLHPTKDNVYFSITNNDNSFDLYRLIIENGKASIKLIVSY